MEATGSSETLAHICKPARAAFTDIPNFLLLPICCNQLLQKYIWRQMSEIGLELDRSCTQPDIVQEIWFINKHVHGRKFSEALSIYAKT